MKTFFLGKTKLNVSPIGLGLAALGRPGYINIGHADDLGRQYDKEVMRDHAHAILDEAWEKGIRYFDAARSYGQAEEFLASWLAKSATNPDAVTVGSKWGYTYTADWEVQAKVHEVKQHTLPVLQRQWQESRTILGDQLDLYVIHSASLESGVLSDPDVVSELTRLQQAGTYIGLSLSGPNQAATLRQAMTIAPDGKQLFNTVQATWNLLETSATSVLQEAKNAGMGIILKEVLANGRLTSRNTDPAFAAQRALLQQEAARLNTTMDALALASALAQPWADVALSGAATIQHLRSNLNALNVAWDEEAQTRLTTLVESPTTYWQERTQLVWN